MNMERKRPRHPKKNLTPYHPDVTFYASASRLSQNFGVAVRPYQPDDINPFTESDLMDAYVSDFFRKKTENIHRSEIAAALFGLLTYGVRDCNSPFPRRIWNDSHLIPPIEKTLIRMAEKFGIIYSHPDQKFLFTGTPLVYVDEKDKAIPNVRNKSQETKKHGTLTDFWRQSKQDGLEMLFIEDENGNPLAIVNFHFKEIGYDDNPTMLLVKRSTYVHPDHQHRGIGTWMNEITNNAMQALQLLLKIPVSLYAECEPNNIPSIRNASKLFGQPKTEANGRLLFLKNYL